MACYQPSDYMRPNVYETQHTHAKEKFETFTNSERTLMVHVLMASNM